MIEISKKLSSSLRFVGMLLLGFLSAIVLAAPASADTVYTYTGNPFTGFQGNDACTAGVGECQLSLSFTLTSPLPANFGSDGFGFIAQVTPLSFSMTDGVHTLTQFNSAPFLLVGTGPSGQIDAWSLDEFSSFGQLGVFLSSVDDPIFTIEDKTNTFGPVEQDFGFASNLNSPGTWTVTTVPTVPEPSSLILLGTGLLGLAKDLCRKSLGGWFLTR
jgi:hypothetical protein